MKIAITNSWPNLAESAELEFIERFKIASKHIGNVDVKVVVTSDDIYEYKPDFVLITHEFSRKLTEYPTIALLWSPLSFFSGDEYRMKSINSFDGYIAGSRELEHFAKDVQIDSSIEKPVAPDYFLPTTYRNDVVSLRNIVDPTLCYLGIHWDGARHSRVFQLLAKEGLVSFYGPPKGWDHVGGAYKGMLPFDGVSVMETIARHGVALCFHKKEHREQNTPSMRIFEALSVGALPICDSIAFAEENLQDVVLFIDTTKSPRHIVKQIREKLDWIKQNPEAAIERAERGKAWFEKHWSLESKIEKLFIPFAKEVRKAGLFDRVDLSRPSRGALSFISKRFSPKIDCDVIVRAGGRSLDFVKRAVDSVINADGNGIRLGIIIVDYKNRQDLKDFAINNAGKRISTRYITSPDTGYRSTALWTGLRAAEAPFVAHLDDDDTVFPNHYRQLIFVLSKNKDAKLAYSGVIKKEDDEGLYFREENFMGPVGLEIKENRRLQFIQDFNLIQLAQFDNYIQSNAWMARTDSVQAVIGDDPELEVAEDVYLYLLLAQFGPFKFTGSATAVWHWRSAGKENSMLSVEEKAWDRDCSRVVRRLSRIQYPVYASLIPLKEMTARRENVPSLRGPGTNILPIPLDLPLDSGAVLGDYIHLQNFHPYEDVGVWSSDKSAQAQFDLDDEIIEMGGVLVVNLMSAYAGKIGSLCVSMNSTIVQSYEIMGWDNFECAFEIASGSSKRCELDFTIENLYIPQADASEHRKLGVLLKSICIYSKEEFDRKGHIKLRCSEYALNDADADDLSSVNIMNVDLEANAHSISRPFGANLLVDGKYSHVEIIDLRGFDEAESLCKIQSYNDNISLQFNVSLWGEGERVPNEYIEFDHGPVFRIYLNGNSDDMMSRIQILSRNVLASVDLLLHMNAKKLLIDLNGDDFIFSEKLMNTVKMQLGELISQAIELRGLTPVMA
ncbi:glycosyltransferase [Gluconacetobacter sp. Hr-1-5]|uniref:glycosyltransferase n=1 Tax=Gluconacetobacter sp. Hr-1-5 TaxID=3395370 RepID=UPI003B5218F3